MGLKLLESGAIVEHTPLKSIDYLPPSLISSRRNLFWDLGDSAICRWIQARKSFCSQRQVMDDDEDDVRPMRGLTGLTQGAEEEPSLRALK